MQRRLCKACREYPRAKYETLCHQCSGVRQRFEVDPRDIQKLRKKQGNKCAICRRPPGQRRLAVDHDHVTNTIRGLLCTACNVGLGCLRNKWALVQAIRYLNAVPPVLRKVVIKRVPRIAPQRRDVIAKYLAQSGFDSLREIARAVAAELGISEDAALSRIRRTPHEHGE